MDKKIVLWATMRRLKSTGFYGWDEQDLAFVEGIVKQSSFEDCLQFVSDRYVDYVANNEERKDKAEKQYESRVDTIENWFATYRPVFEYELKKGQ